MVATALLSTTLVGIAALSVDIGYIMVTRADLQNAADAAALAGAHYLSAEASAIAKAQYYAEQNHSGHGTIVSPSDVVLGNWDKDAKVFGSNLEPYNAVRVTVRRSRDAGNSLTLFFAHIFGISDTEISASAVAYGDRGQVRFLIDDEMFDTDEPAIEALAYSLGMSTEDLLTDGDGDNFIDMPADTIIELPTGQVGDEALFAIGPEFPFSNSTSPSLEDFLLYDENGDTRGITDSDLDPLPGVDPVSDPDDYPSFVDAEQVHVSPVYKSDVSDTEPWVNAKGERRGLVAFKIIGVGADPDGGGSGLPNLIIQIVSPSQIDLTTLEASVSGAGGSQVTLVQ